MTARRALLVTVAALAAGAVLAGLARVGVALGPGPALASAHGPLFVLGVFGTVITLERVVALGRPLTLVVPLLNALGALGLVAGVPFASPLLVLGSLGLVLVNGLIVHRQPAIFTVLMLAGAALLLLGTAAFALGAPVATVTPAWMTFFVLTIVAERLELSRLAPTPRWAGRALSVVCALVALTATGLLLRPGPTLMKLFGVELLLVATWQLRFDLARRTVRQSGLPRFTAMGVLLGACWLLVTGTLFALVDVPPAGPVADAALHALFVGFVLSMVFAHAPIILPAVACVTVPWSRALFAPLLLLHLALALRLLGDLALGFEVRRAGSVLTAASLALFAVVVVVTRSARRGLQLAPTDATNRVG